jgi:hypothetical protein
MRVLSDYYSNNLLNDNNVIYTDFNHFKSSPTNEQINDEKEYFSSSEEEDHEYMFVLIKDSEERKIEKTILGIYTSIDVPYHYQISNKSEKLTIIKVLSNVYTDNILNNNLIHNKED